jgi:hypothetical protein
MPGWGGGVCWLKKICPGVMAVKKDISREGRLIER